jgi:acyl-CoA synthetase (AMP-forming)/AMP-acid ligase II
MDFRFPARASPPKLIDAMKTHGCTMMFGSPALLDNLSRYGVEHNITLPQLKRVLSSGAPVRNDVLRRMTKLLSPDAQIFTPFGATEALPVASIGSQEVLSDTAHGAATGRGICVGKPVSGTTVRIIRISDDPIETWSDDLLVPPGQIGEIAVSGPVVTHEYYARPVQTTLAKIREANGTIVHRMGDVGYVDELGRVWMCGRKSHRVVTTDGTLFSVPVEEIFNQHPAVKRTALVGLGARGTQAPRILIEREVDAHLSNQTLLSELKAMAARHPETATLREFQMYEGPFPVDARHNAKIEREKLTLWAAEHSL